MDRRMAKLVSGVLRSRKPQSRRIDVRSQTEARRLRRPQPARCVVARARRRWPRAGRLAAQGALAGGRGRVLRRLDGGLQRQDEQGHGALELQVQSDERGDSGVPRDPPGPELQLQRPAQGPGRTHHVQGPVHERHEGGRLDCHHQGLVQQREAQVDGEAVDEPGATRDSGSELRLHVRVAQAAVRHVVAAAVLALACTSAADARIRVLPRPIGSGSGTLAVNWTEILQGDQTTRTDGTITYTVEDRLRSPAEAESWVPQPQPGFVLTVFHRDYGYLLRALVSVDSFVRTVDDVCGDGQAIRTTTSITGIVQPHALLQMTQDPTLDLPDRTGETDLRPIDVIIDTANGEQEDVPATGMVATRTTGTDCGATDADGVSAPRPVDTQATLHLGALVGANVVEAMLDASQGPLRIAPGGATVMDASQPLVYPGAAPATESLTGSVKPDVRLAGPPRSQRALCRLPDGARMARVHSLPAARRLLRGYGFPDVVYVPPRGRAPTSFALKAPSPYDFCGVTLGSRRHPFLRPRRS